MISLFLNTASNYLDVAVLKDNKVLKEIKLESNRDLSSSTLIEIEKILKEIELKPIDIDEIYCVDGPGSFTGLRIGVTIAKIYAWSLNKKLYKVSTLFAMATAIEDELIIPLIDARRGYVFAGIYDKNYNNILEDQYIKIDDLQEKVKELNKSFTYVSTDEFDFDVKKYNSNLENLFKYLKKEEVDPFTFVPNYLKKTEAEEKLNND